AAGQSRGRPRRAQLRPREARARTLREAEPRLPRGEPRAGAPARLVRAHPRRRRRGWDPGLLLVRLVVAAAGVAAGRTVAGGVLRVLERVRGHDVADD